jgi:MerR family transcriptional regulator, heat shock protein HspR
MTRHWLVMETDGDGARAPFVARLAGAGRHLPETHLNLAGIARILSLEDDNGALSAANTDLRSSNRSLRNAARAARSDKGNHPGDGAAS